MSWSEIRTFLRDEKGRVYVNPAKQFIQPFELPMDAPNAVVTIPAGGRVGPIPLTARYDGPIEVFFVKTVVYDADDVPTTTYDIDFLLEHPGKRIQFSNRVVPLSACSGDAGRPYVLPETIFIPHVQSLNITFFNRDLLNERKVELVLGGIKFYPNSSDEKTRREVVSYTERRERTYAYWQTTDEPAVLTAGQTDFPALVTVPDDTDLEIFKLTAKATGTFRSRIKDSANDRSITGAKIHSSLLWGAHQAIAAGDGVGGSGGIFPARWATSFLVRRSTKLQVDIDDLSAEANTVKLVLGGRKVSYA
jgi:hypothetical protein